MGKYKNRLIPPSLLGDCLETVLKKMGGEQKYSANKVLIEWPKIVGSVISRNTKPKEVRDGTLIVNVSNNAWLMELGRFSKRKILGRVKELTNDNSINNIIFKLGPVK